MLIKSLRLLAALLLCAAFDAFGQPRLDIDKQGRIVEPKAEIWNCGGDSCPIVIDCANLPSGKCPTLYDFTYHWVNPPELEARFQAQDRELKAMRRDVEQLRKLLEAK